MSVIKEHETRHGLLKYISNVSNTTADEICIICSYLSYKTGIAYETKYTNADISALHPIFTLDQSLFYKVIDTEYEYKVDSMHAIISYTIELMGKEYVINISIERCELPEGVDADTEALRQQIRVLTEKNIQLTADLSYLKSKTVGLMEFVSLAITVSHVEYYFNKGDMEATNNLLDLTGGIHNWMSNGMPHLCVIIPYCKTEQKFELFKFIMNRGVDVNHANFDNHSLLKKAYQGINSKDGKYYYTNIEAYIDGQLKNYRKTNNHEQIQQCENTRRLLNECKEFAK